MDFTEEKKENLIQVDLKEIMETSFLDYSMSVIVSRALPDVRDGLKPVHRRILYTMYENSLWPEKAYRKCADTVGAVLGRYHPHGDASVYDAMVRLAQDFSMRYMLVDGHGNFGSVDGDPPAAYRYTEARMSKLSVDMLKDIDKNTVDFSPNYDDRLQEPTVLPSHYPNILVNGSTGEGDGIDSNGWLVINGGTLTSQACGSSMDGGIDSDMGIHINGGTVIASGNMLDRISEGDQTYAVLNFSKFLGAGTYSLKNSDNEVVLEKEIKNSFTSLIISSADLVAGDYTLWYNDTQLAGYATENGGMFGKMPDFPMGEMPEGMNFPGGGDFPQTPEREETADNEGETNGNN